MPALSVRVLGALSLHVALFCSSFPSAGRCLLPMLLSRLWPPLGVWLRCALEWIFPLSEAAKHSHCYPPVDLYEVRIKGKPHVRNRQLAHSQPLDLSRTDSPSHSRAPPALFDSAALNRSVRLLRCLNHDGVRRSRDPRPTSAPHQALSADRPLTPYSGTSYHASAFARACLSCACVQVVPVKHAAKLGVLTMDKPASRPGRAA